MKHIVSIVLIALLFASCEKVIDIENKGNESTIVIEGNITNEAGPYLVKVSKSLKLSETGSYPTVDNAVVTISDNAGNTETLSNKGNGVYETSSLTGVPGRTYTLNVVSEGKTYTSQSTMPQPVPFDSIKVDELTFAGEIQRTLIPVYKDPVVMGNYYRFLLTVNGKFIDQHLVQNDQIRNGVVNTLLLEIDDDKVELEPDDEVSIQMQCIDKNAGLFYTALALTANRGPSGGTTPNNPPATISNGALGVFSAHTVETKSIKIR